MRSIKAVHFRLGSKKCDIMDVSFKNVIGCSHERMLHFNRDGEIDEEKDILPIELDILNVAC